MDEGGGVGEGETGTGGRDTQDLTATAPGDGLNIGAGRGSQGASFSHVCGGLEFLWDLSVHFSFGWFIYAYHLYPIFVGGKEGIQITSQSLPSVFWCVAG